MHKKLPLFIIPVILVLAMAAPFTSAQSSSYILEPGDTITHGGEDYTLTELVGGQSAKIYYNGSESPSLTEGDTVGELKVTKVAETYVTLEAVQTEEEEEEDEENLPGSTQFCLKLDDGNILVFTDSGGTNGAMGYAFGLSEHPTFLFWSGGNIPGVAKTPPPVETKTIPVGGSYTPQMVPWLGDLVVTVESTDGTGVVVAFETDDSVNIMKTTIGPTDYTELIERLMSEALAKIPDTPVVPPTDTTGITFVLFGFFLLAVFYTGMKWMHGWGQRW